MMDFKTSILSGFSQRQLVCLVVDTSVNMIDEAINELRLGIIGFLDDIMCDSVTADRLEVAIIEFNESVKILRSPALVVDNYLPKFTKGRCSNISRGVNEAIQVVQSRRQWYLQRAMPYYRPWVILITGAKREENLDVKDLSAELRTYINGKKMVFLAIGVNGADMELLNEISSPDNPAVKVQGFKFSDIFYCLEDSTDSEQINLSNPDDWLKDFSV